MSLSNWIYLWAGLVLGAAGCGLFRWLRLGDSGEDGNVLELQRENQQVRLAYEMAREMSQLKGGFLARTTHELRSPLNGLIGLHQLILSDLCDSPEEEREFIAQAHERALKLLHLIDEILHVARIEHGTHQLDMRFHALAGILQEVNQSTYMQAANRNFPLRVVLPEDDVYVLGDYRWLRQVLIGLVETAMSRMEGGSISISSGCGVDGDTVAIYLDLPRDALTESEAWDLMTREEQYRSEDEPSLSAGMKLLLYQNVLAVMGGKLEMVPSPYPQQCTRLQVSMRAPEAELRES